jgi:hypothetical protein
LPGRICERVSICDDQTAASPRQEPTPRGDELPVRSGRGSVRAGARPVLLAPGEAGVTASRGVAPARDDLRARRLASCRFPHRLGGASARTRASPMFPAVPCGRCSSRSPTCSRRRGKDEGFGSAAGVIRFPLVGNRCRHQRPCSISSSGVVARTRLRALRISPRGRSWWRRARAVGACVRTSAIGSRSSRPRRSDASVARSDEGWTRAGSGSGGARPQPASCRRLLGRPCRRCRGARRAVVPAREARGQPVAG